MSKYKVSWMVEHIITVDAPDEETAIETAKWHSYRHAHTTATSKSTVVVVSPDTKCDTVSGGESA